MFFLRNWCLGFWNQIEPCRAGVLLVFSWGGSSRSGLFPSAAGPGLERRLQLSLPHSLADLWQPSRTPCARPLPVSCPHFCFSPVIFGIFSYLALGGWECRLSVEVEAPYLKSYIFLLIGVNLFQDVWWMLLWRYPVNSAHVRCSAGFAQVQCSQ